MSDYRRCFVPGGCYFFTAVTYQRQRLFAVDRNVELLREAMRHVKRKQPFEIQAMVVLPDHLHALWHLPEGDADFSRRWRDIKNFVSRRIDAPTNHRREKAVWQRRFWEHSIRDEGDFEAYCDYIHYNPVKHGLVRSPMDWKHSTFGEFVARGVYPEDWAQDIVPASARMPLE